MNRRKLSLALAAALSVAAPAFAIAAEPATQSATPVSQNPFFEQSTLPYQYPRFDLIKDEHYGPALTRGIVVEGALCVACGIQRLADRIAQLRGLRLHRFLGRRVRRRRARRAGEGRDRDRRTRTASAPDQGRHGHGALQQTGSALS